MCGNDDAIEAVWKPLDDIDSIDMAEDHYYIIQNLVRDI